MLRKATIAIFSLTLLPFAAYAQDKSTTSSIQLPAAGGTVTAEEGALTLSSNTGAATFSLPFPNLPTRGDFGADMALNYSQFAGDSGSGLGVGWSFPVASISVNTDLGTAIPGRKPDGDFFHHLNFMGGRLIFLGLEGGTARYRPEMTETHVEILRHDAPIEVVILDGNGTPETVRIESGFEVIEANGERRYFSGDPSVAEGQFEGPETYVTRWPMVLHVNANREPIRYDYVKHGGRSYLRQIAYAGGQSTYTFDLIDTVANLVSYTGGHRQANAKLYGKVTARFGDTVYDQFCMGFIGRDTTDNGTYTVRAHPDCLEQAQRDLTDDIDPSGLGVLDQLQVVYRFGDTDGTALATDTMRYPDVRFDYSSWTAAELAGRDLVFPAPNLAFAGALPAGNFELADINMDALVDVVRTGSAETQVLLGEGALAASFAETTELTLQRRSPSGLTVNVVPRMVEDRFHFADIMGDTYSDIIEVEDGALQIFNGGADGEFPHIGRSVPAPGIAPSLFTRGNGRFMDINLDGQSDIIASRAGPSGETEFVIYLNLTRRTPDGGHSVNFARLIKPFPITTTDPTILSQRHMRLTDITGDRLPDLVMIRPADQGFCMYENQGNIFSRVPDALLFGRADLSDPLCGPGVFRKIEGMSPSNNLQSMWYTDANGDGIVDFASMGDRDDEMRIWLGFGNGSFTNAPVTLALNERVQVSLAEGGFRSRVADIDADGQTEIIVFQQASGTEINPVVVIDFNRAGDVQLVKSNLLTVVDFDSGRRHDIRYATSTDEFLRDRDQGRETRRLHFPVIVAKQIATSEGIPGSERASVETQEMFYHKPFYDVINDRFVGFAEVERVTYGDEFTASPTQRSALMVEQYHTFAEGIADLHLAGKLKVRRTYQVDPDNVLMAAARLSDSIDPGDATLHSLSSATRRQGLPQAGALLNCRSAEWVTVDRDGGGVWLRKLSEHLSTSTGPEQEQPMDAPACDNPLKSQLFGEFDGFNLPNVETLTLRAQDAPLGQRLEGLVRETRTNFDQSRETLRALAIIDAPSERVVTSGSQMLRRETFAYNPERGGRMSERVRTIFSGLRDVPAVLQDDHQATYDVVQKMTHDPHGNVLSMADQFGTKETMTYDPTGTFPVRHVRHQGSDAALDQVTQMAYDGPHEGRMSHQTTPLGMGVSYDYDPLGRRVRELADDGAERGYAYRFAQGGKPSLILQTRRRYPSAAETPDVESEFVQGLSAYNARGRQIAELQNVPEGGVRVFNFTTYNRNQRPAFEWTPYVIDSFGGVSDLNLEKVFDIGDIARPSERIGIARVFDGVGRPVSETHPTGKFVTIAHHAWGTDMLTRYDDQHAGSVMMQARRVEDENGVIAQTIGDGAGEDHVMTFTRDALGSITSVLLPGETTPRSYVNDTAGMIEHQTIPGLGERFHAYDSRGRQVASARVGIDGTVETSRVVFDFLNRRLEEHENGALKVKYTYDEGASMVTTAAFSDPIARPLGKHTQIEITDPNGLFNTVQRFGYDQNGRIVLNEIDIAGETHGESFRQTMDGRVHQTTGPGGLSSDLALGPDGNLRRVSIDHPDFANGPEMIIEAIRYNAEGRIAQIEYRADAETNMTYDRASLFLTDIETSTAGGPLQDLSMRFNGDGSITQITDALAGQLGHVDRSGVFTYDWKNQLTSIERYGETANFAYAPNGAFVRNDEFAAGETLNPAADRGTMLVMAGSVADPLDFDGFGQLVRSSRITDAAYDVMGRLIRAETAEATVHYGYDQTGRRLYKQISPSDGSAEAVYLYPLETYTVTPSGPESFVNLGSQKLVRMEHGTGAWFYYLKDHLSSSDYVMTSDGVPVEQMLYRAYGTEHAAVQMSSEWADAVAARESNGETPREPTRHRFTGKYLDDDTGLYYFGARYYDPHTGRFVTPDPLYLNDPARCITGMISCGLYAYANNNPMAFVDPTGLKGIVAGDAAYRKGIEERLQKIDPTARVNAKTGEITQDAKHGKKLDALGKGKDFAVGRELVRRIIADKQTTTIKHKAGKTAADWADKTKPNFKTKPGDVTIAFDLSVSRSSVDYDPKTKTTSTNTVKPGIVIGHELIHANHMMAGTDSGDSVVAYKTLDGKTKYAIDAELTTVGLGGTARKDDITENQLREMMGVNPRNQY